MKIKYEVKHRGTANGWKWCVNGNLATVSCHNSKREAMNAKRRYEKAK